MDDRSRMLDRKYMSIAEMEKRIEGQKEMIALLKSADWNDAQMKSELERYKNELEEMIQHRQNLCTELLEDLRMITHPSGQRVLYMRYMDAMTFDRIAKKLNCTVRWAMKLRDIALCEIVENKSK
ncbi:MAG: hypothetical protein NC093_10420 [Alistipes sp.]|nr:hypothetical protein [Alistipes sp.]